MNVELTTVRYIAVEKRLYHAFPSKRIQNIIGYKSTKNYYLRNGLRQMKFAIESFTLCGRQMLIEFYPGDRSSNWMRKMIVSFRSLQPCFSGRRYPEMPEYFILKRWTSNKIQGTEIKKSNLKISSRNIFSPYDCSARKRKASL